MKNIHHNPRKAYLTSLAAGLAAIGAMLCGNITQAQPTISGIALPNANNALSFGVGAVQFEGAVPPALNTLTFTVTSATGVTALTANVSATALSNTTISAVTPVSTLLTPTFGLTVTGVSTNESALLYVGDDTLYSVLISATDAGGTSTKTVAFDTLNPNYYTWEAEDFDYGGGQFIDSFPTGGGFDVSGYYGLTAISASLYGGASNIDCKASIAGGSAYRPNPLATENATDVPRAQYKNSGFPDYDVGNNSGGNWANYTRNYPGGIYNIYARLAGGSATAHSSSFGLVTAGWGTTNQTTNEIGTFSSQGLGYNGTSGTAPNITSDYTWCPAQDPSAHILSWAAAGDQETIRFTVISGSANQNFFMLLPATPFIAPANTNVYQGNPATLSFYPANTLTGVPPMQWLTDGGSGGALTNISGATTTNYTVPTGTLGLGSYRYAVALTISSNTVVNGSPVSETLTSAPIALQILAPTKPIVVESTYPASATAAVGAATSFTGAFTGSLPITYQWFVSSNNGATFTPILTTDPGYIGATNQSLTVLDLSLFTNEYELEGINSVGNTTTTPATLTTTPAAARPPLQVAGDLVAELRSVDLVPGATTWTNRSGSGNSLGNFYRAGQVNPLSVSNNTISPNTPLYGAYVINALYMNANNGTYAVQSTNKAPAEICTNGSSTVEAWIYAVSTGGNNVVAGWGIQGGSGAEEQDREECWGGAGHDAYSGDFGSYDNSWPSSLPSPTGAWHYAVWTWNGTTETAWSDGVIYVYKTLGATGIPVGQPPTTGGWPIDTLQTDVGIGGCYGGLTSHSPSTDSMNPGYIASVRISSGVLNTNQIINNFAAGPFAEVPVTVYAPSVSPGAVVTAGATVALGAVSSNALYAFNYQWYGDNGTLGATWTAINGATNSVYDFNTTNLPNGVYEFEVLLTNSVYGLGEFSSPVAITVNPHSAPTIVQDITPSTLTTYVTVTNMLSVNFAGAAPLFYMWQSSSDDVHWLNTGITTTNINIESEVATTEYYRLTVSNSLGANVSSAAQVIYQPPLAFPTYLPVQTAGDVIVNLQQADLSSSRTYWSNVTSSPKGVGNFSALLYGGSNLVVTTGAPYLYNRVNSLFVNGIASNALQSLFLAPAEILGNLPVSAETWVFANSVSVGNNTTISYGNQEQNEPAQTDREFNYYAGGTGCTSGDFGSFDHGWTSGTVTAGAWHYLAFTYDGITLTAYMDGNENTSFAPSAPNATPETLVAVGGGFGQDIGNDTAGADTNLSVDVFYGYVGAARLMSGVLSANQIQNNYTAGLMGELPAVVWAPSVTPFALNNLVYQGSTVTLGLVDRESTTFTYQWYTDGGTAGVTWSPVASATGTNLVVTPSSLNAGTTYGYEIVLSNSTYSLSITSAPVDLTVETMSAPVLEDQPAPATLTAYVGQTVTFTAGFSGNTPLTNQWQYSATGSSYANITNATSSTLTLSNVQLASSGDYRLTASNSQGPGTPSQAAVLTVTEPPNPAFTYTAGSLSITWPAGGTLVSATSLLGPWTPVGGATSPYAVTPATGGTALFYAVSYEKVNN